MKALIDYILLKSSPDIAFHNALENLLGSTGLQSQNHVGFIFSERLINMPVQTVPPMYRMLAEEVEWALEEVTIFSVVPRPSSCPTRTNRTGLPICCSFQEYTDSRLRKRPNLKQEHHDLSVIRGQKL